jgi:hypothetical protein
MVHRHLRLSSRPSDRAKVRRRRAWPGSESRDPVIRIASDMGEGGDYWVPARASPASSHARLQGAVAGLAWPGRQLVGVGAVPPERGDVARGADANLICFVFIASTMFERMLADPFREWLPDVAADAVVVDPSNIGAEAQRNLWSFSITSEMAAALSIADVEAFAAEVADARRAWLSARGAGPMVLYWWHDTMAGQLRFSLVSAVHGRLPFGCHVIPAASFRVIAGEWLKSPHLDGIPWSEFRELSPGEESTLDDEPPPLNLPVWSLRLP